MTMTLNTAYAVQNETAQQEFPALQANVYQPKNKSEKIKLCLSESSFDLLENATHKILGDLPVEVINYGGDEDSTMFMLPSTIRFVFLNRPGTFVYDKDKKNYSSLTKGVSLSGTGKVTACKLFVAIAVDDELLLKDDGSVQVFTLKLTSSKTAIVGGYNDKDFGVKRNDGDKTLLSLNNGLEAHYKTKGWLTHLVSVDLQAKPCLYTSSATKASSMGIKFCLGESAKPLPEQHQKTLFELVTSESFKAKVSDPFGVSKAKSAALATTGGTEEEIPF